MAQFDAAHLLEEGIDLLRQYIRIDTTNPPGDVAPAADWVEGVLGAEGFRAQRVGPSPDKANLAVTIGQENGVRPLVLAHHMDVVPAVAGDWSVDPFAAEVKDGYLYGRGTLDMKGFGVLSMLCLFAVARSGAPLRRPLRVIATADEEVGGVLGAKWLADNHLDEFGGEFLLTEGSFARAGSRALYYPVVVAEKGVSTIKQTARGKPGHASAPSEDNAVVRVGRAIARIGGHRSPPQARDLARRYLSAFPPALLGLDGGRTVADLSDEEMEETVQRLSGSRTRTVNLLRNTFSPTMVQAGVGQNVIPAKAEAWIDCRSVPGVTLDDLLGELREIVADDAVEMEPVKSSVGTESPSDTELFEAMRDAVLAERPEAVVVPYLTGGGTDAKHLRPKGVTCYGLIPFVLDDKEAGGIHGIDERVSIENLEHALRVMLGVVERVCLA